MLALLRTQPLADTLSIGPMIYIWSSLGCQWINSNDQPIVNIASAPTIIIGNNSAIFQYQIIKGLFCHCGYIWIPARISDHILSKVYEEITYPFDDVIEWKHFLYNWSFLRGIPQSPVNFPHKGLWRETLMFSLNCAWINVWVNTQDAGDLRRHRANYDVTVMGCDKSVTDDAWYQYAPDIR